MTDTPAPQRPAPWWARFAAAVRYVTSLEPAIVAALWRSLAGVMTAAGFGIAEDVDARILATIAAVYVVVEVLTTLRNRARGVPVAKLPEETVAAAAVGPLPGSPAAAASAPPPGRHVE